jgi:hypothetical protein
MRHGRAHLLFLVTDDGEDALWRRQLQRRVDDVFNERAPTSPMQNLGAAGPHACAQAGGQYDECDG